MAFGSFEGCLKDAPGYNDDGGQEEQQGRHRLVARPFDCGAAACIVSRAGMEAVLDMWFTDRTADGLVKPLANGKDLRINAYYAKLPGTTYVVEPSLFTVAAASTKIGKGGEETDWRLARQRRSNERHRAATRALWGDAEEEEKVA